MTGGPPARGAATARGRRHATDHAGNGRRAGRGRRLTPRRRGPAAAWACRRGPVPGKSLRTERAEMVRGVIVCRLEVIVVDWNSDMPLALRPSLSNKEIIV